MCVRDKIVFALLFRNKKDRKGPNLLITPETTFLYSDGDVCFGQGVAETRYTAPEVLVNDGSVSPEKVWLLVSLL